MILGGTPELNWWEWLKYFLGVLFFSILFWGRKIWQVTFWEKFGKQFFGIQNNLKVGQYCMHKCGLHSPGLPEEEKIKADGTLNK